MRSAPSGRRGADSSAHTRPTYARAWIIRSSSAWSPGSPLPAWAAATGPGSWSKARAVACRHARSQANGPRNVSSKSFHSGSSAVWMTLPEVSVAVQGVHRDVERLDGGLEAVAGGLHERGVGGRQRAVGEEARGHASELVEDRVVGEVAAKSSSAP
jgi:hypothetical protein